jgi:hypothetical protein
MTRRTERHQQQAGLDPVSEMISNILGLVNSGTITIDIDKQPLLRLIINQGDTQKINLEFGQKFTELLFEASVGAIKNIYSQPHTRPPFYVLRMRKTIQVIDDKQG